MSIDQQTAPHTAAHAADWTRDQWLEYADRLLAGARAWASPGAARITPPGEEGGYGRAVDGLEGFARTFLLAGFRIVGEQGQGLDDLADFYRRGVTTGVDPDADDRWVRLDEHPQAKVEAASIALVLDMTRPWIWDRLDGLTQQRVIDYLAPVVGDDSYPKTNWLWFRVVVQTFLRSVGGPWSADDIAADLALHDSLVREDGWLSDGFERSYDHYVGWALHLYPVLWARMQGAAELAAGRTASDVAALDRFLLDAIALVGADGSPMIQGRSLIYRFAAAAPFWIGVMAQVPSLSAGRLRHAADRIVGHFAGNGVPDREDGLLTMGWHHEWRALAQSYSGPGSPYWAVKGLIGISLPADHPVWAAAAEPLPVEVDDTLRAVRSAGWIVSGTSDDGIVRLVNHGTDHAAEGSLVGDSPLYARIGYSTATSPLVDATGWEQPLEQSVAIVDSQGRATHRAAMTLIDVRIQDDEHGRLGIAASTSRAHWLAPRPALHRHGSGIDGDAEVAARLTVHSLVRGPWELRVMRADALASNSAGLILRIGGWPLAGDMPAGDAQGVEAVVRTGRLRSGIRSLLGGGTPGIASRRDASPLGPDAVVPYIDHPLAAGEWVAALVELAGLPAVSTAEPSVSLDERDGETTVTATWPDGLVTTSRLADPGPA